jgi:hypothetical protein
MKGDPTECGNYRGIKLLEHAMKILEKVVDKCIRDIVTTDKMQFGFMPGRGTTGAMFIVRQIQEKYIEGNRNIYDAFVDMEKANIDWSYSIKKVTLESNSTTLCKSP